ncbi:MAG: transposase-like protein [Candidatus Azotimanducaceae bacterium]|jgi:transposase-like protein
MSKSRKFSPEFKQGATEQVRRLGANLLSRRKRETKTSKPLVVTANPATMSQLPPMQSG